MNVLPEPGCSIPWNQKRSGFYPSSKRVKHDESLMIVPSISHLEALAWWRGRLRFMAELASGWNYRKGFKLSTSKDAKSEAVLQFDWVIWSSFIPVYLTTHMRSSSMFSSQNTPNVSGPDCDSAANWWSDVIVALASTHCAATFTQQTPKYSVLMVFTAGSRLFIREGK